MQKHPLATARPVSIIGLSALVLGLAACRVPGQWTPALRETMTVEVNHVTTFGQSVFLTGDCPELGLGDWTASLKLVPGTWQPGPPASLPWRLRVHVPSGQTIQYRLLLRNDAPEQWKNPANGSYLGPLQTHSTREVAPATRDWTVFVDASSQLAEVTFHTPAGPTNVPLVPGTAAPDTPAHKVAVLPGQMAWERMRATVGSLSIDTPAPRVWVRGSEVLAYVPQTAAPLTAPRVETLAIATNLIRPTRTVNGVTGRGVRVWLPRGYDQQPDRRYPVIVMHDGQNVLHPGGPFGSWRMDEVAADLIRRGRIEELIIVAVDNSEDRFAEYWIERGTQTVSNTRYNQFIIEQLVPAIEAGYRVRSGAGSWGVGGSSLGGLATLQLGLADPELFGRLLVMSPSFWASATTQRIKQGDLNTGVRMYLDAGDSSDGAPLALEVRDALLSLPAENDEGWILEKNLRFRIGPNQAHNEAAWYARLPGALEFLYPPTDLLDAAMLTMVGGVPGSIDRSQDGSVGGLDLAIALSHLPTEPAEALRLVLDRHGHGPMVLQD